MFLRNTIGAKGRVSNDWTSQVDVHAAFEHNVPCERFTRVGVYANRVTIFSFSSDTSSYSSEFFVRPTIVPTHKRRSLIGHNADISWPLTNYDFENKTFIVVAYLSIRVHHCFPLITIRALWSESTRCTDRACISLAESRTQTSVFAKYTLCIIKI